PNDSIDLLMYFGSEGKDREIKRIMRMMKQCAIGCQVNRSRNIRQPPDVDGTSECDYDLCNYQCVDEEADPNNIDYSTYDVIYSAKDIEVAKQEIFNIFKTNNTFTIQDIIQYLQNIRTKHIIMALENIITTNTPIRD